LTAIKFAFLAYDGSGKWDAAVINMMENTDNAVFRACSGACTVATMPLVVFTLRALDEASPKRGAASEIIMFGVYACVDDVDVRILASRCVVDIGLRSWFGVGYPCQPPSGAILRDERVIRKRSDGRVQLRNWYAGVYFEVWLNMLDGSQSLEHIQNGIVAVE
jgi:hypothetical protein